MVKNPGTRWSSYGEAIGGGAKIKEGRCGQGWSGHCGHTREWRRAISFWKGDVALEYRRVLLVWAGEKPEERVTRSGKLEKLRTRSGMSAAVTAAEQQRLRGAEENRVGEIPFGRMLRCRVWYFTDGAVIGRPAVPESGFRGITRSISAGSGRMA